jgi:hypothetical protein
MSGGDGRGGGMLGVEKGAKKQKNTT